MIIGALAIFGELLLFLFCGLGKKLVVHIFWKDDLSLSRILSNVLTPAIAINRDYVGIGN